jgi:hypothetical protein
MNENSTIIINSLLIIARFKHEKLYMIKHETGVNSKKLEAVQGKIKS